MGAGADISNLGSRVDRADCDAGPSAAVLRWGLLVAQAASTGRPRPAIDLQIAAIAAHHGLVLASRNVQDFAGPDLDVVNPWGVA